MMSWVYTALLAMLLGSGQASLALPTGELPDLTSHGLSWVCLAIFVVAYTVVIFEEQLGLRKSIPVILGAGAIWALIGFQARNLGLSEPVEEAVRHYILEFGELFLFLLAAMTYINTMAERGLFQVVRDGLIARRLSLRKLFWLTGVLAFFLSPIADNLTTALLMGTVLLTVAGDHPRFLVIGCTNIVVAANAGGAFSPFGDITTLMVWQKGLVEFGQFFHLFLPSLVNWVVPAVLMTPFVETVVPEPPGGEPSKLLPGAIEVALMFLATVAAAVAFHALLHLPPVMGMLTGLGALKLYGAWLSRTGEKGIDEVDDVFADGDLDGRDARNLDIFSILERAEWDTLMFFAGVILCVGGLGTLGYLSLLSAMTYGYLGPSWANICIGVISAVLDNIPVMVAVLGMNVNMDLGQWLLVTLTAGVGGSLLSIGSAAGVALMGQARGTYTFMGHLRWSWAVALGYAASIAAHFALNRSLFGSAL